MQAVEIEDMLVSLERRVDTRINESMSYLRRDQKEVMENILRRLDAVEQAGATAPSESPVVGRLMEQLFQVGVGLTGIELTAYQHSILNDRLASVQRMLDSRRSRHADEW